MAISGFASFAAALRITEAETVSAFGDMLEEGGRTLIEPVAKKKGTAASHGSKQQIPQSVSTNRAGLVTTVSGSSTWKHPTYGHKPWTTQSVKKNYVSDAAVEAMTGLEELVSVRVKELADEHLDREFI